MENITSLIELVRDNKFPQAIDSVLEKAKSSDPEEQMGALFLTLALKHLDVLNDINFHLENLVNAVRNR